MNKRALGLSVLGSLLFTAPAFSQGTKTDYKEEQDVGKKGSTYKAEKTRKSGDVVGSTTDQEKVEKKTKKNAKGGTDTEMTTKSKHPAGKTHTTKEKTQTDASGNVVKEEKTKN